MENDLKWIKKHYGEKMMHMCREFFSQILEDEGALPQILQEHFAMDRKLAEDIENQGKKEEFKQYIYSLIDLKAEEKVQSKESAVELLKKAGYTLYPECKTEKEIQSFKKWWKRGEELCTFNGGRLNSCRVWFAVKDNASELKREDFKNPKRQDEYGTSVISIQFSRGRNQYLSIKNRYNHMVSNPDNTFKSDLDNIIPGLSDAFERDFGVCDNRKESDKNASQFELENYFCFNGKFHHFNQEINNKYYCDNNLIIDEFEEQKLPNHQMLIDYFIVDFKEKTITKYDNYFIDNFTHSFNGVIKNMTKVGNVIFVERKNGEIAEIEIDERNNIVSYKDEGIKECFSNFLSYNLKLRNLELPNLEECGDSFLTGNKELTHLYLPKLKECGKKFLECNTKLEELDLPNLEYCKYLFLNQNEKLKHLHLPKLKECGYGFLESNLGLEKLELPSLEECGDFFLNKNEKIKHLHLPKLKECYDGFLDFNSDLEKLKLPSLRECGKEFLSFNQKLSELSLPKLERCGESFLYRNEGLKELSLPNLKRCEDGFLFLNEELNALSLPKVETCGKMVLYYNKCLKELSLPNLTRCDTSFLDNNRILEKLELPKLRSCEEDFLGSNKNLKELDLPSLCRCAPGFLYTNKKLEKLSVPMLTNCGDGFLKQNKSIKEIVVFDERAVFKLRELIKIANENQKKEKAQINLDR